MGGKGCRVPNSKERESEDFSPGYQHRADWLKGPVFETLVRLPARANLKFCSSTILSILKSGHNQLRMAYLRQKVVRLQIKAYNWDRNRFAYGHFEDVDSIVLRQNAIAVRRNSSLIRN
jgi:hypothetical protein